MAELASSFKTAETRINPNDADCQNAPEAHKRVRGALDADETLKGWGIDSILIGSYDRDVSIRRVKDVDAFCRLPQLPEDETATNVYDRMESVLEDEFPKQVTRNDRSLSVTFAEYDDLYVDAVAARPSGEYWEIPTADGDWQETNPTRITELKTEMNEKFEGGYVPLVKMMRQVRRHLRGDAKPGGLAVEMALYTACDEGQVTGTGRCAQFASALAGVADVLERVRDDGFEIPDPSMPGKALSFRATDDEWARAAQEFRRAAADAKRAYDMPEDKAGKAALLIQAILGGNVDFKQVFPMPDGYDDDGNPKAAAAALLAAGSNAGRRNLPAGDGRFA